MLHRLAQHEGDGARLGGGVGEAGGAQPFGAVAEFRREALPGFGRRRRPHGFRDQPAAGRGARLRPVRHVAARHAEPVEQLLQCPLRVAFFDRLPAPVVEMAVEARQHDEALRHGGDAGQQVGRCRHDAGRAGGDDAPGRGVLPPERDLRRVEPVAPVDGVEPPLLLQDCRPVVRDDGEEVQRLLPVRRELLRHQRVEAAEIEAVELHLVDQPGERAGKLQGAVGRDLPVALHDEPRQQQAAAERRDRGPEAEVVGEPGLGFGADGDLVSVQLAEGEDARQQQHLAARHLRERLDERAPGPVRRQQHDVVGERRAPDKFTGERFEEGRARGDGDGIHALASMSSAWARRSGVPASSHMPSQTRPNSLPSSSALS